MKMKWVEFPGNKLPPERRYVFVQTAASDNGGSPPCVAVGYLRIHSDGPFFVIPGIGRKFTVTHFSDTLGDNFYAPLWAAKQLPNKA